jgi:hypothetical protein
MCKQDAGLPLLQLAPEGCGHDDGIFQLLWISSRKLGGVLLAAVHVDQVVNL